jgi:hypothetical protein
MLDFARMSSQNCSCPSGSDVTRHTEPDIRNKRNQHPVTSTLFPFVSQRLATSTGTQSFPRETLECSVGVSKPESKDTVPLESNPVEHP